MAEIAFGPDNIPYELFQHLCFWKAAIAFAFPYQVISVVSFDEMDLKNTARGGDKRDLTNIRAETLEKFLRHPSGT